MVDALGCEQRTAPMPQVVKPSRPISAFLHKAWKWRVRFLGSMGVPNRVAYTKLSSCHRDPALSRSAASRFLWLFSTSTSRGGSGIVRREVRLFGSVKRSVPLSR
jgi:hypothetical protein